jgi:hypothetical protein
LDGLALTAQEAHDALQELLDKLWPGAHGWVEKDHEGIHMGTWEEGGKSEIEIWPWKGEFQPYAPHSVMAVRWGSGGSWEIALKYVQEWLVSWQRTINPEGYKNQNAPKETSFLLGKLVDPE